MSKQLVLYSDGGGKRDTAAGAGCIVEDATQGRYLRLVTFLGGATNNEAEICGGLLGFAALQMLKGSDLLNTSEVRWVCDSEYVLKSATGYIHAWQKNGWKTAAKKPVKNQGLWRSYLALSRGFEIKAEHVYGHRGHPENEACDSAATWAQEYGESAEEGAVVRVDDEDWLFVDGRSVLALLRKDSPAEEELEYFLRKLESLGFGSLPSRPANYKLLDLLSEAEKEARKCGSKLADDIAQILEQESKS